MMVRAHRVFCSSSSICSRSNNNVRALFFFPISSTQTTSSSSSTSAPCHRTVSTTTRTSSGLSVDSSTSFVLGPSISKFLRNAQEAAGYNHHLHSSFLTRQQHSAIWWNLSRGFCSETTAAFSAKTTDAPNSEPTEPGVEVIYFRGLPQFTIPLPSRREKCRFIVKPLANTVGDLMSMIREEDKGVDRVALLSTRDGVRISASNTIEMLMENDFDMVINDRVYRVKTPPQEKPSEEELERLSSVRNLVGQLYAALNVDEHQLRHENEMMAELEKLLLEVQPMEEKRKLLAQQANKRTTVLTWVGLGLMSVQFGILARLTFYEYSWDIMEPITYFVTYGTAMLAYAYFVLTKQEYVLPDVKDRQYLIAFHKNAKKIGLDVERYNQLKTQINGIEVDLKRLRDPLALHLPLKTRLSGRADFLSKLSDSSTASIIHKLQELWKKSQQSQSQSHNNPTT